MGKVGKVNYVKTINSKFHLTILEINYPKKVSN